MIKVGKSLGSHSEAAFENIFEWGLKKDKISLLTLELKKVDKSFGSLYDATFSNIMEWGLKKNKISLLPTGVEKSRQIVWFTLSNIKK